MVNVLYVWFKLIVDTGYLYRISGFYKDPGTFGATASFLIIYLITTLLNKKYGKWKKIVYFLFIPLVFFSMFISGSRTGVLITLLTSLAYVFFQRWNKRGIVIIGVTMCFIFVAYLNLFEYLSVTKISNTLQRFTPEVIADSGGAGRLPTWHTAILHFWERPFIGIGMSQYRNFSIERVMKLDHVENTVVYDYELSLHNNYLTALIEYGIIGFIIFMTINIFLLKQSYYAYKKSFKYSFAFFSIFEAYYDYLKRAVSKYLQKIKNSLFKGFLCVDKRADDY